MFGAEESSSDMDGKHLTGDLLRLAYKVKGPDRLALVTDAMRAADCPDGDAGPGTIALNAYVVAQSRRMPKPMHMAAAGPSGTGKSFEVDTALQLIDPAAIYNIGDGSEKFMQYDIAPLTGRVVYFAEATPLQRDGNSPLAYATRTLMSEGLFRYRFVDFEKKDANFELSFDRSVVRFLPGVSSAVIPSTFPWLFSHSYFATLFSRRPSDRTAFHWRQCELDLSAFCRAVEHLSLA